MAQMGGNAVRNIAERIKRERIISGLTQDELATAMGLRDRTQIAKIEAGTREVAAGELAVLAEIFQVTVADLLAEPVGAIRRRVDLGRPETQEAVAWLDRCIDNSLFVRRLNELHDRG
jgi:transcriptional regulator with XRE-family HTH domain